MLDLAFAISLPTHHPRHTPHCHPRSFHPHRSTPIYPRPRRTQPPLANLNPPSPAPSKPRSLPTWQKSLNSLTSLFPIWVILASFLAYIRPTAFLWFTSTYIVPTLALIMLAMGLTIPSESFTSIAANPRRVFLGASAQYTIMPLLGYAIATLLRLPIPLAVGVILVSVCPGGAASNVVCFIAGADVALSVILTLTSTLLSVVLIPTLMQFLAGTLVPISSKALFVSTAQVVILPLLAGVFLRRKFPRMVALVSAVLPLFSVLAVALINAAVVAANASALAAVGFKLVVAIATMHALGALGGYAVGKLFRTSENVSRTLCIEVMMQNSSLAVSLATSHFSNPLTAIPGAISATMHSIMGSALAAVWRMLDSRKRATEALVTQPPEKLVEE